MDAKSQPNGAVVEPIKIPKMKMKIAGDKVAGLNAFAVSFAMFFGVLTIFAAIAGFTSGNWVFGIPLIGAFFANVGAASVVTTALLSVAFGIIALMTIGKITDAQSLSKSWNAVSKVFFVLMQIYAVSMIGIAIYSLLSLGKKTVDQGDLWLSGFLPNFITAALAGTMAYVGKKIADGKTVLLRTLSMIAMGIAGVAFVLVIIQTLVSFYATKSSSSTDYRDYDYGDVLDLFR